MACTTCRRRKLRCDGTRPLCSNCLRLSKECEYVDVKQKRGPKKRNVQDLEQHLATLDEHEHSDPAASSSRPTTAGSEATSFATLSSSPSEQSFERPSKRRTGVRSAVELEHRLIFSITAGILQPEQGRADVVPLSPTSTHRELGEFGANGQLNYDSVRDELTRLFFRDVYPGVPIVHESRYYASLQQEPARQPPLCLRHVMWALAAIQNKKWSHLANSFYEKAKEYLEQDELKEGGDEVLNVAHVQCWSLIAAYETYAMMPLRAWSSIRRAAALAQMLRLHTIDDSQDSSYQLLPEAVDPSELEERRRAFWSAFCSDRWASARTGYPMTINENEISVNLPSSEDSFNLGWSEETQSLTDALELGLDTNTSLYGARAVLASILGRVMSHVLSANSATRAINHGQFWNQHNRLDNLVSKVSQSRSERLRPSNSTTDTRLWAFDMWLHGLTICLHQTAIDQAKKENDQEQTVTSLRRCRTAADHIIGIVRSMAHIEPKKMDPFTASCVYMASTVLIRSQQHGDWRETDLKNLRFLQQVLEVLHKHWKIAEVFINQFNDDLVKYGINLLTPCSDEDRGASSRPRLDYFQPADQGTSTAVHIFSGLLPT